MRDSYGHATIQALSASVDQMGDIDESLCSILRSLLRVTPGTQACDTLTSHRLFASLQAKASVDSSQLFVLLLQKLPSAMAFTVPKLPYDYSALEPSIDATTMQIHHGKHHQVGGSAALASLSLHAFP